MAVKVLHGRRDDVETLGLDNGIVCVEVAPQLGGRIVALRRMASGFNHVYPSTHAASPADCAADGGVLHVRTSVGTRRIVLDDASVVIEESGVVAYPWLVAAPDCELVLPQSVITVDVEWSATERFGGIVTWPWASANDGAVIDLAHLDGAHLKVAERFWSGRLREGFARYEHPTVGESLAFAFDCDQVPHMRLHIDQGGAGAFSVCIEPRIAKTDTSGTPETRRVTLTLGTT